MKETKKKIKPKNTDEIIKVNQRLLLLEADLDMLKTGLKLALSRLGLHKELKDG